MFALAAFAQANALEQTFARPPHRSNRPARRQRGNVLASLIGRARRIIAGAGPEPAAI